MRFIASCCNDCHCGIRVDRIHLPDLNNLVLVIELIDAIFVYPQVFDIQIQCNLDTVIDCFWALMRVQDRLILGDFGVASLDLYAPHVRQSCILGIWWSSNNLSRLTIYQSKEWYIFKTDVVALMIMFIATASHALLDKPNIILSATDRNAVNRIFLSFPRRAQT